MPEDDDASSNRFELASGLTLALLAALTAVNDLGGGKFGDDEIVGHNEKAAAYSWYQSKSIKETTVAQEAELLQALTDAGAVVESARPAVEKRVADLQAEVKRYKAEKKEILQGSAAVGPEGQVLDKDGQKGQIVGAQEWERTLEVLGEAGDRFDGATLWLQLSMVAGAISLVVKSVRLKWSFYAGMVLMGLIGSVYTVLAWQIAGSI